jgi:4-oxalocrotonate tautomerase
LRLQFLANPLEYIMPEVVVYAVAGRSPEQKKALMTGITKVVVDSLGVAAEQVVVQIVESPSDSKSRGGIPFSERQRTS